MNLSNRKDIIFIILAGFFITNTIVAELIGGKLIQFFGLFTQSIGIILWPIVFVMTDLINEYFGKSGVRKLTFITIGLIIYTYFIITIGINMPSTSFSPVDDFNKYSPNGDSTAPREQRRRRIPMNRNKRFYSRDPTSGRVYYIDPQGGEYYLDEHDLTDLEDSDADAEFTANMKSSLAKDLLRFCREGRCLRIEASKSQDRMDHVEMRKLQIGRAHV